MCVQSLVIAMAVLFINLYELSSGASLNHPHLFSVALIIPFIAATLALLAFNWSVLVPVYLRCR